MKHIIPFLKLILFAPILLLVFYHNKPALTSWLMVQQLGLSAVCAFVASGLFFGFSGYRASLSAGALDQKVEISNTQFFFLISFLAHLLVMVAIPPLI